MAKFNLEDASSGIDEIMIRQPLGVTAAHWKRVQCQGAAKNYVLVMPDADLEMSARMVSDSAFGCAGQRCLAISAAIMVGRTSKEFTNAIGDLASNLRVGNGLEKGVRRGPVISQLSNTRIAAERVVSQILNALRE